LLADDGFGGRRSSGWGHAREPEFQTGAWPDLLLPKVARANSNGASNGVSGETARYWMLSLYSPAANDGVDWRSGDYKLAVRGGRVESKRSNGISKKSLRMVAEGSVLVGTSEPGGSAVDVAPEGSDHPVFRSGLALALKLPEPRLESPEGLVAESSPIEEPETEEAVTEPCETIVEPEPAPEPEPALEPEPEPKTEPLPETTVQDESLPEFSVRDDSVVEQPAEPSTHTVKEASSAEPDPEKSPSDPKESGDAL
jgi:hypothetical protein